MARGRKKKVNVDLMDMMETPFMKNIEALMNPEEEEVAVEGNRIIPVEIFLSGFSWVYDTAMEDVDNLCEGVRGAFSLNEDYFHDMDEDEEYVFCLWFSGNMDVYKINEFKRFMQYLASSSVRKDYNVELEDVEYSINGNWFGGNEHDLYRP